MFKSLFGNKPKEVQAPAKPTPAPAPAPVKPVAISPQPVVSVPVATPAPPPPTTLTPSAPPPATAQAQKNRDISLYKNLLAGLYDGVIIFDQRGNVLASNARAEQFLGYTNKELWGMQSEALIVGINARVLYKLQTNAESGRFTVVNGTCRRQDGTTFPSEIAISRIRFLNEGDLIFSIRNIERREKVREQREMSEEAIRYAGAGIVVCSTEGSIEFTNEAFLKLLNVEDEHEVLKHMIGDYCSSYEAVTAMIHTPSLHGLWLGSLELVTPKGIKRSVMVTSSLSQVRRGGIQRLVITMTPIPKAIAPTSDSHSA